MSFVPPAVVDSLFALYPQIRDPEMRALLVEALVGSEVVDDRLLAACARLMGDQPARGAACLARYGDARAIPELLRALDDEELVARADCAICAAQIVTTIASAIVDLGGTVSETQRGRVDRIVEAANREWLPGPDALASPASSPPTRGPRPGRNAPCPCGSGKKYKKCCGLAADAGPRH